MWNKSTDLDDHADSGMHSVVRGRNDYDLEPPSEPGTAAFEDQKNLFLDARLQVTANQWPDSYFEALDIDPTPPKMFEPFGVTRANPTMAATLVDHSMDHPSDLHRVFSSQIDGPPALYVKQADRSPASAGVDFLGARWLDAEVQRLLFEALEECFQVKYLFQQVRPEHYFDAGLLVAEYGCPKHWAYPAGHGASAGVTLGAWLALVDISPAKATEFRHAAQHLAHYRTLAGVHWPEDNDAGLQVGEAVAQKKAKNPS